MGWCECEACSVCGVLCVSVGVSCVSVRHVVWGDVCVSERCCVGGCCV